MKATEKYFPVVLFIMRCKVVLTFEVVDGILKCELFIWKAKWLSGTSLWCFGNKIMPYQNKDLVGRVPISNICSDHLKNDSLEETGRPVADSPHNQSSSTCSRGSSKLRVGVSQTVKGLCTSFKILRVEKNDVDGRRQK